MNESHIAEITERRDGILTQVIQQLYSTKLSLSSGPISLLHEIEETVPRGRRRKELCGLCPEEEEGSFLCPKEEEGAVSFQQYQPTMSPEASIQVAISFQNQYIVVTLLVAIEGKHKLPTINSSADLKEALENLGSIPSNNILAAEVLWTPQQENGTLSVEELIEDYPLLKRF